MSHDKPTRRLEDTPVVDDGDVDMADLSKSGTHPETEPTFDGQAVSKAPNPDDFFFGFIVALLLSSVVWGAVWIVV